MRACGDLCWNHDTSNPRRSEPDGFSAHTVRRAKEGTSALLALSRQFFITHDEEGPDEKKNRCREYTLLRNEEASQVREWILGNTKIGPVLDVKVCVYQGRHCVEVMIESLFRDRTVSWVRIVDGINKYVTETSETISLESVEHRVTGKLVAKVRPQLKPAVTLSPISIPIRERK